MVGEAMGPIPDVDAALLVVDGRRSIAPATPRSASWRASPTRAAGGAGHQQGRQGQGQGRAAADARELEQAPRAAARWCRSRPRAAPTSTGWCDELWDLLPEGAPLYGPDMLTDRTERFLAGGAGARAAVREAEAGAALRDRGGDRDWQERADATWSSTASIVVERDTQRGIVVGKGGAMIRDVGTRARLEISELLERPAHLKLRSRSSPTGPRRPSALARAGLPP